MATIEQIESNRRNAKKSTGPRTPEGKSAARMNALKSGIDARSQIIPGEDLAGLETLIAEYLARFQPATPEERFYVDILIRDDWQLRRLGHADARIWDYEIQTILRPTQNCEVAQALSSGGATFMRLQRRIDSTERSYHRALRELERVQSRRPPVPPPQPIAQVIEMPATSSEIGFVPSLSGTPPESPSSPESHFDMLKIHPTLCISKSNAS